MPLEEATPAQALPPLEASWERVAFQLLYILAHAAKRGRDTLPSHPLQLLQPVLANSDCPQLLKASYVLSTSVSSSPLLL